MSSLHNTGFTGFNPINLAGPNMGQNQSSSSHAPKTRPGHSRCSHQPDVDNLSVQDLTANSIWLGKHFLPKGLVGEATKARYAPTNPSRDFVPSGTKNEKRHLTCETCLNFGRSRALTLIFQYMQQGTNLVHFFKKPARFVLTHNQIRVVPFKVGRDNLLYVVLVPIVPRRQSLPYAQKTSFGLLKVDGSVSHEMRFTASAQSCKNEYCMFLSSHLTPSH
jgi:hypothetical protein